MRTIMEVCILCYGMVIFMRMVWSHVRPEQRHAFWEVGTTAFVVFSQHAEPQMTDPRLVSRPRLYSLTTSPRTA